MTRKDPPTLSAQHAYVAKLKGEGFKFGLTVGDAFVRGIRDLGYKSNADALAELIDNSHQAGATRVDVAFGYDEGSDKKPVALAVIDDGHGMEPDMIRLAVLWGGTHREGDRSGMGRYGYGLPSSCVSIGQSFTVYSKAPGGEVFAVMIDLPAISAGEYTDAAGEIIVPAPLPAVLPPFVQAQIDAAYPQGWTSGTAVVINKLDRLEWTTAAGLGENLSRRFGVTYHKLREAFALYVDGSFVEPIDPLFLTPGARWYDLDEDRAQALETLRIPIKAGEEARGEMVVRFAYMPPTFGSLDKGRDAGAAGKNANPRFAVMKEHHGILFSRMGRLIDVTARTPWTTFVNNDRYIKVEVEFPAALDEEFGITTAKQQVTVSDYVWETLRQAGVPKAIEQLRGRVRELKQERREALEAAQTAGKRPSVEAMEAAKAQIRAPSAEAQARQKSRGEERLAELAGERAQTTGRPVEEEKRQLVLELGGLDYRVEVESAPGAPFFRCDVLGGAKVLYLNRAHRFYADVYDGPQASLAVRSALEVLLFAIADSILDAPEDSQRVYRVEVPQWSLKLDLALERLAQNVALSDDRDSVEPAWNGEAVAA